MQKKILNVRYGWRGISGVEIAPGEYREDDAALAGMASYLIENGHASVIRVVEVEPEEQPADDGSDNPATPPDGGAQPIEDQTPAGDGEPVEDESPVEDASTEVSKPEEQPTTSKRSRR